MLRTDLFQTRAREETRYIAVRDTLTPSDPKIGPEDIDAIHCRQGRLGIGYHYLITVDGTAHLGRRLDTVGSHSRALDEHSVAIGIVGGINEEGVRADTRTEAQKEALESLLMFLKGLYPDAEVDDHPQS